MTHQEAIAALNNTQDIINNLYQAITPQQSACGFFDAANRLAVVKAESERDEARAEARKWRERIRELEERGAALRREARTGRARP